MTKRRLILPVLAAVGLIAAGCGGGSDTITGSSTDTTDTTATDTTSTGATTDTTSTDRTSTAEGTLFTDSAGKYSIVVPSSWKSAQDSPKAWFLNEDADSFRENVNILTETIPSSMDLDSYVDLSISKAPGLISDFTVKEKEKVTLDSGQEAYKLVYTGTPTSVSTELSFTFLAVVAVEDGTAVTLTMTAPPETFDDTIDENWAAIKSLKVL